MRQIIEPIKKSFNDIVDSVAKHKPPKKLQIVKKIVPKSLKKHKNGRRK